MINSTINLVMQSGIYCIKNILNGKVYIGSTQDLFNRGRNHFNALNINKHHNRHLQAAYNLQNRLGFIYGIIEFCDLLPMEGKEQQWINELKSNNNKLGYNIRNYCSSNRGYKQTDYMKECIRKRMTGRVVSKQTRDKLRVASTGRTLSEASKDKLRKHNLTTEQLEKIAAPHKGKPSKKRLLSIEQVEYILHSDKPSRLLGIMFGVSKPTILNIRHRKTYVN